MYQAHSEADISESHLFSSLLFDPPGWNLFDSTISLPTILEEYTMLVTGYCVYDHQYMPNEKLWMTADVHTSMTLSMLRKSTATLKILVTHRACCRASTPLLTTGHLHLPDGEPSLPDALNEFNTQNKAAVRKTTLSHNNQFLCHTTADVRRANQQKADGQDNIPGWQTSLVSH